MVSILVVVEGDLLMVDGDGEASWWEVLVPEGGSDLSSLEPACNLFALAVCMWDVVEELVELDEGCAHGLDWLRHDRSQL